METGKVARKYSSGVYHDEVKDVVFGAITVVALFMILIAAFALGV